MMSPVRRLLAALVTLLASVAMLVALLAAHASALADAPTFANGAVSLVRSGPVRTLIVDTISPRVQAQVGSATNVRPLVSQAVGAALSNPQVTGEIQTAAATLQSELITGQATQLTLSLPSIGPAMAHTLQARSPQLAYLVSRLGTVTVVDVPIPSGAASTIHAVAQLAQDAGLLAILAAALAGLALILSVNRRATLIGLGLGAVASGLVAVGICIFGRGLVIGAFTAPAAATAAGATWHLLVRGLENSGLLLAAAGAAVVVLSALAGLSRRS